MASLSDGAICVIFLSYNWRDQAIAHEVDILLRQVDFNVWIDYRDLRPDADILKQLDQAIQRCSVFLTVQPGSRNGSRWMRTELSIALAYGKTILPFRADALHLPGQVGAVSRAITAVVAQRSDARGVGRPGDSSLDLNSAHSPTLNHGAIQARKRHEERR
jgi:TIR domain